MAVDSGLSVPVFNVLKYFVISVFLEAIVRTSLDNVKVFFRAFELYHGRPVSLSRSRIDRYSLSSIVRLRSLRGFILILFLACVAYSVELLLEFSSDASANQYAVSGRLYLFQPTHRACTPMQLDDNNTIDLVMDLASSCVVLTDDKYTFYNVSWQRQESSFPSPLCVHTSNNILHEDSRIYKFTSYANGSLEERSLTSFLNRLQKYSWQPNVTRTGYVTILGFTNADVKSTSSYTLDGRNYTRAVMLSQIANTSIQCSGMIFGRHGDGFMSLRVYGCFEGISGGRNYIEAAGTSLVKADAELLNQQPWNTLLSVRIGNKIYNFTSSTVEDDDLERIQGLTMLLSSGFGKNADLINKYAVVHKHCSDYLVPQRTDDVQAQAFGKVDSEQKITVTVSGWALVILVVWPILLSLVSFVFHMRGKRKKLPMNVYGEGDMGQRWFSRSNYENPPVNDEEAGDRRHNLTRKRGKWGGSLVQQNCVFFNVEKGETEDDIVVGRKALFVERDKSHTFKKVD